MCSPSPPSKIPPHPIPLGHPVHPTWTANLFILYQVGVSIFLYAVITLMHNPQLNATSQAPTSSYIN